MLTLLVHYIILIRVTSHTRRGDSNQQKLVCLCDSSFWLEAYKTPELRMTNLLWRQSTGQRWLEAFTMDDKYFSISAIDICFRHTSPHIYTIHDPNMYLSITLLLCITKDLLIQNHVLLYLQYPDDNCTYTNPSIYQMAISHVPLHAITGIYIHYPCSRSFI